MNENHYECSLKDSLIEFAKLFDPPIEVIQHKSKSSFYFCIYAQDGAHLSFNYIDHSTGINTGNGCFFNIRSEWNSWQQMFANGGKLYSVRELIPQEKYKTTVYKYITTVYYEVPKFNTLEELRMKLAIIGPQFPTENVKVYELSK